MAGLSSTGTAGPSAPTWWHGEGTFDHALEQALGTPSQRERWKYSKRDKALELLTESPSDPLAASPEGMNLVHCDGDLADFLPLDRLLAEVPETLLALCRSPLSIIDVPADASLTLAQTHSAAVPPVLLRVGANASLTLTEYYEPDSAFSQCLWLSVGPGARVMHHRRTLSNMAQWQFLNVELQRDASYSLTQHSTGAEFSRQDIRIDCREPGADAELTAAACIAPQAHLDQQVTVQHRCGHNSSRQTIHNIAADGASVTCNGRIHIHPQAPGAAAHLSNRNLCLGNATINTKPELEIYTDDVQCSHGATVGRLDEQQLFYAISRGIDPQLARELLSRAFLREATVGPDADVSLARFQEILAHG